MEILSEFDCKDETVVDRPSFSPCKFTPDDLKPLTQEVIDILVKEGKLIPLNNMETINRLNDEELARFLDRVAGRAWLIGVHGDFYDDGIPNNWEEWLQWLHKEVDTDESFTPVTK